MPLGKTSLEFRAKRCISSQNIVRADIVAYESSRSSNSSESPLPKSRQQSQSVSSDPVAWLRGVASLGFCVVYLCLNSATTVTLDMSSSHHGFSKVDVQAIIATYIGMSKIIVFVFWLAIFFASSYRASLDNEMSFKHALQSRLVGKKEYRWIVIGAFLDVAAENAQFAAVADMGSLNAAVIRGVEVIIVAIAEMMILHKTYSEIHLTSFIVLIGLTISFALGSGSSEESDSTVTLFGCACIAGCLIFKAVALVLSAKVMRDAGEGWIFSKAVTGTLKIVISLVQVAVLTKISSVTTLGSIIAAMDEAAIANVWFQAANAILATLILKWISPMARVASKSFKSFSVGLLTWVVDPSSRLMSANEWTLLMSMSGTCFIIARMGSFSEEAYRLGQKDALEQLDKVISEEFDKQEEKEVIAEQDVRREKLSL